MLPEMLLEYRWMTLYWVNPDYWDSDQWWWDLCQYARCYGYEDYGV